MRHPSDGRHDRNDAKDHYGVCGRSDVSALGTKEGGKDEDEKFMLLPVTGRSGGNRKNTVVSAVKHRPTMLQIGPKMGPTVPAQS